MQFDHAIYFVNDLQRARDFYTKVLGLSVLDEFPGFVRIRISGDHWLGLHMTELNGDDVGKGPMIYLRTSDLAATLARFEGSGAKITVASTRVPTGLIATIADSEGNAIGLYQPDL